MSYVLEVYKNGMESETHTSQERKFMLNIFSPYIFFKKNKY